MVGSRGGDGFRFGVAQERPPRSFDVVSVRPNLSGGGGADISDSRTRFTTTNVGLRSLMTLAFGVNSDRIVGWPAWVDKDKYDIVAKSAGPTDPDADALRQMLQAMLADRFSLKFHRDTRELPVFSLTVLNNGSRLTPHAAGAASSVLGSYGRIGSKLAMTGATMAQLADQSGRIVGRTVIDNTGLKGAYDFTLERPPGDDPPDTAVVTLLREQFGLKLESAKGPVEVIVIDSVDKASEN